MNIFAFDRDAVVSARYLHDVHVRKMLTESVQIVCSAIRLDHEEKIYNIPEHKINLLYKKTHHNHPCVKWVRESRGNLAWMDRYINELSNIYSFATGKAHKASSMHRECVENITTYHYGLGSVVSNPLEFVNCTSDPISKNIYNVHDAYQYNYATDKVRTKAGKPMMEYKYQLANIQSNISRASILKFHGDGSILHTSNANILSHRHIVPGFVLYHWLANRSYNLIDSNASSLLNKGINVWVCRDKPFLKEYIDEENQSKKELV